MILRAAVLVTAALAGAALFAWQMAGGERTAPRPATSAVTTAGAIQAGDAVPRPKGEPTVRIRGVRGGNAGGVTELDVATLELLPRSR